MGWDVMILVFWMLSFKPVFSLSSFTFIKRAFNYSSVSAVRVVSSAYLRLIFFTAILISACESFSLAFHMMCFAYKLNKQGDHIRLCIPFSIFNHCEVPCLVSTVASWPEYRFPRRQVRWSGIPISLRISRVCCDPHHFAFLYYSWGSRGKKSGVVYHFILQWTIFLSELSTMTHPSWVALHTMTHNFIELCKPLCRDKTVIHEGQCVYMLTVCIQISSSLRACQPSSSSQSPALSSLWYTVASH